MLQFFRTYQKIFFIIITVVIGVSFVFFGTFTSLPTSETKKDRLITKAIDGTPLMQNEVEKLSHFLSSSSHDVFDQTKNKNLLNDGVIEKDFLASGLGAKIAKKYFPELQEDLLASFEKAKSFRPYTHPHAPFLHAEMIWENYSPELMDHLRELRSYGGGEEAFSHLASLYVDQLRFPPDLLRRVLHYQQNQYSWFPQDEDLKSRNLGLFGYRSLEEWFGPKWIEAVSQFIINAAGEAKLRGYVVSSEEAEASLLKNVYDAVKIMDPKSNFSYSDAYQYMQSQSHAMGLDEKDLVKAWQNVLLFRRLFSDLSGAVFVDHFTYQNFADFAKQQADVEMYHLPQEFCFSDFRSLLKSQVYFDAIKKTSQHPLDLPREVLSASEVEKKYPELVYKSISIEFSKVEKKQFHNTIALKDLWFWQVKEIGWNSLMEHFPELANRKIEKEDDRFLFLEQQSPELREKIDRYSMNRMIPDDYMKNQLLSQQASLKTIQFRSKQGSISLAGISSEEDLIALLEIAPLKGEEATYDEQKLAYEKLQFYTQDEETYYSIDLIEKPKDRQIVTFAQASRDDTLDQILDDKLEDQYQIYIKKNNPIIQKGDGKKKSFMEAKDQIAAIVYAPLLDAIKEEYRKVYDQEMSEVPLDAYGKYRFLRYLQQVKNEIEFNGDSSFVARDPSGDLHEQWKLCKDQKTIERSLANSWIGSVLFDMPVRSWSKTQLIEENLLGFFYIADKSSSKEASYQKWEEEKHLLGLEAKKIFMEELLEKIANKQAIILSHKE